MAWVHAGDCREWLPTLESDTVDAVITDPPYPEIDRPYGRWTEAEWRELMDDVVEQCRRILKPSGSAVLVLAPNSERVGRMRTWLWHFMADWGDSWGIVQDVWWWNHACLPVSPAISPSLPPNRGLCRPSLRACVWLGTSDCYRNQDSILMTKSDAIENYSREDRITRHYPSGRTVRQGHMARQADNRGGVTPLNVLPIANTNSTDSSGAENHGAGTPRKLCDWWVRYICPPGGLVVDPFCGAGTVGRAAVDHGRKFAGCEKDPAVAETSNRLIRQTEPGLPL